MLRLLLALLLPAIVLAAEPPIPADERAKMLAGFTAQIAKLDDAIKAAPHWRLGIAYYFAGAFAKSAKQFVKYQDFETGDRENGIWKFLADVKTLDVEAARREMLTYTRFDREPFPTLYEMFAGKKTTDELFADVKTKDLTANETVMFFANYYAGLNEGIFDHREKALELLHKAVAGGWKSRAGEPSYMWQVARLHYEAIAAK